MSRALWLAALVLAICLLWLLCGCYILSHCK